MALIGAYAPNSCVEEGDFSASYAEVLEESERWQSHLDRANVVAGTVVGLKADYSVSSVGVLLALLERGAVAALIPHGHDIDRYLTDACASSLISMDVDGSYEWRHLPPPRDHPLLLSLRVSGDGGIVLFSSGSTGRPKAALQSVDRFLWKFRKPGRRFRTLAFLLFDHIAGLDTLFYTLCSGGTLVLTRRRDPHAILDAIASHKVEVLPASPSFLRLLCVTAERNVEDVSSLRIITYGSEPMDANTLARLQTRFPNAQISQKYGTTETGAPRTISRGSDSLWLKIRSDGVDMKVIDNVLWLRSEATMLGYLNAPSPMDEEGWYCTGDLVDVDGEWIRFRGRAIDTINVGGQKVAPFEVEQSILELEFVCGAVVVGQPHELMGQIVCAHVVLAAAAPDAKEVVKLIRAHCRERLAPYKVPVRIVIGANSLCSGRQKVQRQYPSSQ